jgi:cytochrome c-type biogenesis protein CcmH
VKRALAVCVLVLAVLAPTAAASERHPTLNELEGRVMCPTCKGETLDESDAPAARRLKQWIAQRIAAGDSRSEIERKLERDFGPQILASPRTHGFDLLAWLLPLAGIALGAVALAAGARHWVREREPVAAPGGPPLDPELERRLDDELARFEP